MILHFDRLCQETERATLQTEAELNKLEVGLMLAVLFMLIFFAGLTAGFAVGVMR